MTLSHAQRLRLLKIKRDEAARAAAARNAGESTKPPETKGPEPDKKTDAKPRSKYADVDSLDLTVSKQVGAWKDSDFGKIRVYDVEQLNDDDANLMGRALVKAITEDTVTSEIVFMCLSLAVSLRSTSDPQKNVLNDISQKMTNKIAHKLTKPDEEADEGLGEQNAHQLELLRRVIANRKNNSEAATRVDAGIEAQYPHQDRNETLSDKTSSAAAYAYIAAFLLRLQCRDPAKVVGAIDTARGRYAGFYDAGGDVLETMVATEGPLKKIRDILARKPEITSTWVAWVSHAENEQELARQDRGLLEYLALQVFAYQGMHVVVQVLSIHQLTKYPIGALLRELDCRMTRSAVQEVYNILRTYQKNATHMDRKSYFRYARVWDEGYFARVQSKNCPQLLYLAAKTVMELSPNSNSDPTQIYAIQNMSETMKSKLDAVAARLLDIVMAAEDDDEETGGIWKGGN